MNKIINKFLLSRDKFMPDIHLRNAFMYNSYNSCELLSKNKERIQKFKETEKSRYIYRNNLDKDCFQHDMTYFLIKSPMLVLLKVKLCRIKNWRKTDTSQLFENLKKVPSSFKSNIFCADHENMELISKYNKGFCFLICLINVYSKYVWVVHLKNKRGITTTVTITVTVTITNLFQTNLDESNHRPNKIWIYKCRRFYNISWGSNCWNVLRKKKSQKTN